MTSPSQKLYGSEIITPVKDAVNFSPRAQGAVLTVPILQDGQDSQDGIILKMRVQNAEVVTNTYLQTRSYLQTLLKPLSEIDLIL